MEPASTAHRPGDCGESADRKRNTWSAPSRCSINPPGLQPLPGSPGAGTPEAPLLFLLPMSRAVTARLPWASAAPLTRRRPPLPSQTHLLRTSGTKRSGKLPLGKQPPAHRWRPTPTGGRLGPGEPHPRERRAAGSAQRPAGGGQAQVRPPRGAGRSPRTARAPP